MKNPRRTAVRCIKKTTRETRGSIKPMAVSRMQCRMDEKIERKGKKPDEGKRQIVDKSSDVCDTQRLPLLRELSAKLTEGEKRSQLYNTFRLSPPVTAYAVPAPSGRGPCSAGRPYLRVDTSREEQRAMPAYEEPPFLPGVLLRKLTVFCRRKRLSKLNKFQCPQWVISTKM